MEPELELTNNNFALTAENGSQGVWKDFRMLSGLAHDDGLLAMPVAGPPGTPCLVVRTHAPMMTRQVQWTATKMGGLPEIPRPESIGENDVLLNYTMMPAVPVLMSNGLSHVYATSGTYSYVLLRPVDPDAGVPTGASPIDSQPAEMNVYPGSSLRSDLIGGTDEFIGEE